MEIKTNIREYAENMPVTITSEDINGEKRLVIKALNEGGCNCTLVDLKDVIKFLDG